MFKKYLFILLMFVHNLAMSCDLTVIAFKGLDSAFDHTAFYNYVKKMNGCSKIYEWHQTKDAVRFISKDSKPFHLYGFSKGARSVAIVMKQIQRQPQYIITIGAWHTVDLDFRKYNVNFNNYFDESGSNQRSPGIKINNVPHMRMQEHVNQYYK